MSKFGNKRIGKKMHVCAGIIAIMLGLTACTENIPDPSANLPAAQEPAATEEQNVPGDVAQSEESLPEDVADENNPTLDMAIERITAGGDPSEPIVEDTAEPVVTPELEQSDDEYHFVKDSNGKIIVDVVLFMGQSNMAGYGGNPQQAPEVPRGKGFEYRVISDPGQIYPIFEPFGKYENRPGGICDAIDGKKGSMVSSFALKYYELTGIPIVAVSASVGGTTTKDWLQPSYSADLVDRFNTTVLNLNSREFVVRKKYAVWLQGESDAEKRTTPDQYGENMWKITKPLFEKGLQKVFFVTPGKTLTGLADFGEVINKQIEMCHDSGYYVLATTVLSGVPDSYMVDGWHYNQSVMNLVGEQAAESAAYVTNNNRAMCLYDYRNNTTYIPQGYDYPADTVVDPLNLEDIDSLLTYHR